MMVKEMLTEHGGKFKKRAEKGANGPQIFDTNNEYHDMDSTLVLNLNQAAINGIRSTGATSQYIFVEGNSYSGAWTWPSANDNLKALTDPQDKLVYQMHQYLDADGSGTSEVCVSATIGAERVASATNWLRENGKVGIIGEFAGGANAVCRTAVQGLVEHLKANQDVWTGALWWGGGPVCEKLFFHLVSTLLRGFVLASERVLRIGTEQYGTDFYAVVGKLPLWL